MLFKETQESIAQLIKRVAGLGWVCDLHDHRQEQRNGHRSADFDIELDSFFGPEEGSNYLLKSLQLTAKHATLQFLGRTEAAEKVLREFVANDRAHLETAKERIAKVKDKSSAPRRFAEQLDQIERRQREGGTKVRS